MGLLETSLRRTPTSVPTPTNFLGCFRILTNTVAGLENADESMVEAARGVEIIESQIMRKVKLPLALPVIFAGIRTSALLNVWAAYLAFFIGAAVSVSGSLHERSSESRLVSRSSRAFHEWS